MKNKRFVNWLKGELPELIQNKVISKESADKIDNYYESRVSNKNLALAIFSVIGAALIVLGIISLLAYNWSELSRPLRALISITPLLVSLGFGGWIVIKEIKEPRITEGVSVFWVISIGLAISLISQTYHIQGDMERFLVVWSLLSLPIIYLLGSTNAFILYLGGITWWAGYAQTAGGNAVMYWLLIIPALPFYIRHMMKDKFSNIVLWMSWALIISLTIAIGTVLEKYIPGLWIIVYSSFFTVLYLLGAILYNDASNIRQMPFQTVGFAGSVILSWMLTFEWPWGEIGWNYYRSAYRFHEWAGYVDYIFVIGMPIVVMVLLMRCIRAKKEVVYEFGIAPLLAVLCFLAASETHSETISMGIFNVYFLILSIMVIIRGVKFSSMKIMNAGMIMFAGLILARFFDSDIGFVAKGIVFITLGIAFLVGNVYVAKRKDAK